MPAKNKKDLGEVPQSITKGLELVFVDNTDEVIEHTLEKNPIEKKYTAKGDDKKSKAGSKIVQSYNVFPNL